MLQYMLIMRATTIPRMDTVRWIEWRRLPRSHHHLLLPQTSSSYVSINESQSVSQSVLRWAVHGAAHHAWWRKICCDVMWSDVIQDLRSRWADRQTDRRFDVRLFSWLMVSIAFDRSIWSLVQLAHVRSYKRTPHTRTTVTCTVPTGIVLGP